MEGGRLPALALQAAGFAGSYAAPLWYMGMLERFLEPRQGKPFWLFRYAACWIMFNNVIFIGDAFNILALLPVVFLLLRLGFRCRGTEWMAASMLFYALSASLSALADSGVGIAACLLEGWDGSLSRALYRLADCNYLTRMAILLPACLLVRRRLRRERRAMPSRLWRLVGLLAALPFAGTLAVVTLVSPFYAVNPANAGGGLLPVLAMLPLFFLSSLALLYTASVLAGYEQLRLEAELARMNQAYYAQLEQQQQQARRLRHDMANHLTALSALIGEAGEASAYLKQLREDPGLLAPRRYCGEPVMDAVLGAKAAAMEAAGIEFQTDIALREPAPLEGPELCALLGNILDNAIEASAKTPEGRRQVRLVLRAERGLFVLRQTNPCLREVRRQGGRLLTSKGDASRHGFGTESVRAIVEKHGGGVEFTQRDGLFTCMLYLPLK